MKETIEAVMTSLARWPLLLGAAVCWGLALYEEAITDNSEVLIGVAGMVVGSVLLGAWIASYIVAGERKYQREQEDRADDA